MIACRWMLPCGLFLLGTLVGCSQTPGRSPSTGANEVARVYYEALLRKDWTAAYAALHTDSRSRLNMDQFARLAENYRSSLGFEPESVQVQICDERGTDATVHVVLVGHTAKQDRRYKDAATLQRGDDGWRIILPQNFGRSKGS